MIGKIEISICIHFQHALSFINSFGVCVCVCVCVCVRVRVRVRVRVCVCDRI